MSADVREGATLSDDVVPTGQRSSAVATGRPRVLVIGGKLKHVRKARELGLDVVHAQFPDEYDRGHWPYVDQALLLDYGDIDRLLPLVRALHEAYPLQAAVSLFELGLLPTARINEALGLGGESVATVELLLDKWRMRRHLAARGISPVASAVGRSAQDVREFVQAHGLPIIVKPIRESGSLGVFCIRDRADVDVVAERFRSLDDGHWAARDLSCAESFDEFLMEEFLDGPEISVETLTDGRHVVARGDRQGVRRPRFRRNRTPAAQRLLGRDAARGHAVGDGLPRRGGAAQRSRAHRGQADLARPADRRVAQPHRR
jgi:biotin carboxylase